MIDHPVSRGTPDGFGQRLREALRRRDLRQAQLARRLGAHPQWLSQLINEARKPSRETVQRIADALDMSVESLAPDLSVPEAGAVDRLRDRLRDACAELGAMSFTFYLRDPLWREVYRLVTSWGIQHPEPMFGLSIKREDVLGAERFTSSPRLSDETAASGLDQIPDATRRLFGGFCEREGVGAYARVAHPADAASPEAVLFLNYRERRGFSAARRAQHHARLAEIVPDLPAVQRQLTEHDRVWLAEGARIVQPASSITTKDLLLPDLGVYFQRILESALDALGIAIGQGLGAIHLYNPDTQALTVAATWGHVNRGAAESYSVVHGAGLASWVVRRRRAILIADTTSSGFRPIHVPLNDDVRSELAAPLDVDGELLGVLTLQCTDADRLKPHHVRSVWYAANRLAIVHRLHSQAEMNRKLLEVCSKATRGQAEAESALVELAFLAAKHLRAHACNLWLYDAQKGRFVRGVSSDGRRLGDFPREDSDPPPATSDRSSGFSVHLARRQCAVWLGSIRDARTFDAYYWFSSRWEKGLQDGAEPAAVNRTLQGQRIRCQLGIPITFQDRCIGVAWVKFTEERQPPSDGVMALALGFTAAAGLILEAVHHQ